MIYMRCAVRWSAASWELLKNDKNARRKVPLSVQIMQDFLKLDKPEYDFWYRMHYLLFYHSCCLLMMKDLLAKNVVLS